jgi:hypothetical protein
MILFFLTRYHAIFFTLILIAVGGFSMVYIRFFRWSHYVAFELCTMSTVLTSIAYGPVYGAATGFFSIILGFIVSGYFKPTYFISILAMPLIGLIAPIFIGLPIWQIGMIMTVIYDGIILPLYVVFGSRISSSIVFFITHLFLNFWIFRVIAPFLVQFM